jgi:long-chain acyl-CoA synthetase
MESGVVVTYGQLLERVSHTSAWLRRHIEFRSGRIPRIGLACTSGTEYIVLALAILKSGACLVPVAGELTTDEREDLIGQTGLQGLVLGSKESWRSGEAVTRERDSGAAWLPLDEPGFDHEPELAALDPAFIRFSSGTTGRSKGVVLSHGKLRERIEAANAALGIGPGDRVLWMLPMAHHFAVSIILYLYHGACTVIGESHLAEEVLTTAHQSHATVVYAAPFHYALLAADGSGLDWPHLRLAVSTAAALPVHIAIKFAARYGKNIAQGLGIIEVGLPLLNTGSAGEAPDAVGRPLPAYDVELRDEEGRPVASGKIGELWIKGPGMFDAYLSPWQTVEELCVDGWFATGDLAETDAAGRIYIRGRRHGVINVSGMKVFPEEVEEIIRQHPQVSACRVYGINHPVVGTIPIAEILPHEDLKPSVTELTKWCRSRLSAYKVPARFQLVRQIETTASGKIRRH